MVLFILLLSILHPYLVSEGSPVASDANIAASLAKENPKFLTDDRSTIQIVWTCLAVIIASTWVCVHPNVPGYKSKRRARWGIKGILFLNALFFPDQSVVLAYRQWMGARSVYSEMAERRMQSQFLKELDPLGKGAKANLGQLKDNAEALLEAAERLRTVGQLEKEAEWLAVGSRRLDTEWGKVRLMIAEQLKATGLRGQTEPEPDNWSITHAHFIQMGGVAFRGINNEVWYKDFKDWTDEDIEGFFALMQDGEEIQDRSKADALSKAFVIIQGLWFVVQCIGRTVYRLPLIGLEVTSLAYIACNIAMYAFWWHKPLNVACPAVILSTAVPPKPTDTPPYFSVVMAAYNALYFGNLGAVIFPYRGLDDAIPDSLTDRFPVVYHYVYDDLETFEDDLVDAAALAIFGALHAIAWSDVFPSRIEQLLWRSSSVTPAILALVLSAADAGGRYLHGRRTEKWVDMFDLFIFPISLLPCFAARLAFLVLPALQFRDLPPLAYQDVPWSDFLPHV